MQIKTISPMRGRMVRVNETPADFSAANSLYSPKLPNVIRLESNTEIGKAKGTKPAEV